MARHVHPETGETGRRARATLIELLAGTVLLSVILDALVNILPVPSFASPGWWACLGVIIIAGAMVAYLLVVWDDRRIGRHETRIEIVLPYVLAGQEARAKIGKRSSYPVTKLASEAWWAAFKDRQGLPTAGRDGPFTRRILPEHMELVRYLLLAYLAQFGKRQEPGRAVHGWLRLEMWTYKVPWSELPPLLRDNCCAIARDAANPQAISLPEGTTIQGFDEGEVLLRLRWEPPRHRWLGRLLGLGRRPPGAQVTVRWLGPLSEVRKHDKRYEHVTDRLPDRPPSAQVHVVATRLVVSVESRWNFLGSVDRFCDWGINLARYWQEQMDYWTWYEGYLRRQIDYLDWKIGWIARDEEPSLAERLQRIDERLARLESHLWPDEPPQGGAATGPD
ncbi:MAG TPA: hypothetical protein ENK17_01600 [Anaerolineae bacterium]|nr:hypothetical protein [Anaerolineae bacterium]